MSSLVDERMVTQILAVISNYEYKKCNTYTCIGTNVLDFSQTYRGEEKFIS